MLRRFVITTAAVSSVLGAGRFASADEAGPKRSLVLSAVVPDARASLLRVQGQGGDATVGGTTLGFRALADGSLGPFSIQLHLDGALGGGGGGVEGQQLADLLVGVRGYVTPVQGPFARVGVTSRYVGNDLLVDQYLAPLTGEAGYEYVRSRLAFQFAFRGAYATSARWGTGDARRTLDDSPVFGAVGWMMVRHASLSVAWWSILPSDGRGMPLDVATTSGCVWWWAGRPERSIEWRACADFTSYAGGEYASGGSNVALGTAMYSGVSFGLGSHIAGSSHE